MKMEFLRWCIAMITEMLHKLDSTRKWGDKKYSTLLFEIWVIESCNDGIEGKGEREMVRVKSMR